MTTHDPLDLDLVRAYVEGRMAPAQRSAFDTRLANEPGLAELVSAYAFVQGIDDDAVPPMQTRFEDLRLDDAVKEDLPRVGAPTLLRPLLALAAVFVLVLGALLLTRREPEGPPPPVVLMAIPASATAPTIDPVPAALIDYAPTGNEGLRFIDGYVGARAAAALAGRPLLVFAQVPSCPLCRELERGQFREEELAKAAEAFVLVREDMMKPSPEFKARLEGESPTGWPWFVVDGADGKPATVFALDPSKPMPDAAELARLFTTAYTALSSQGRGFPTPWNSMKTAVLALQTADSAETERARSDALTRVSAVAPEGSELEKAVQVRREAQAARARASLDAAREAAAIQGLDAARALLTTAAATFEGTPFHADFGHVAEHLARYGSFPVLEIRK